MDTPSKSQIDSTHDLLQNETNFYSLFSTIIWLIDHDLYTNVAMNLDVNFQRVKQENFRSAKGMGIRKGITEDNGDTFQNSQIHLVFYEKVYLSESSTNSTAQNIEDLPELSSISSCKLKNFDHSNLDNLASDLDLQLILQDVTAQFVSQEQYEHLLFVLGQRLHSSPGWICKEILTLFQDFPTNTVFNFKDMLH